MPINLLQHKSWHVYNSDNVERVRKDEAEAEAREEAQNEEELRIQAARRIALLRGEAPPALPDPLAHVDASAEGLPAERKRQHSGHANPRKRRKRGEDDTDRDIRHAREDAEAGEKAREVLLKKDANDADAPLIDYAGHLQLIPAPDEKATRKQQKNEEFEAEKAKKRKKDEDQYTMRFSNAAGFNNGMARPWYAGSDIKASSDDMDKTLVLPHVEDKNAWGNEDPRRKERELNRISSSDPFAAMQQAQRQLKQSERDKERWQREREAQTEELGKADEGKRHEKRHHQHRGDEDSLEGFSLDTPKKDDRSNGRRHHRHRRHRSSGRSGSRDRHRRSKD